MFILNKISQEKLTMIDSKEIKSFKDKTLKFIYQIQNDQLLLEDPTEYYDPSL